MSVQSDSSEERAHFDRNFRTDVFALLARGTFGNAAKSVLRGPASTIGILPFSRTFLLRANPLQFRTELYNAFNHTRSMPGLYGKV